MEYLMNFMERLEEGLSEDSSKITTHMRVSEYRKKGDSSSESFLTDDPSELARSTTVSAE